MLEELLRAAAESGLEPDLDLRKREFRLRFEKGADPGKAPAVLYPLLAALEENFLVTVAGAPACLLPDAAEHFTWPLGARGPFRRAKACSACALKGRCPGVNKTWAGATGLLRPVLPCPAELVLELNKECNLACRACFGRSGEQLPLKTAETALREAAALGVKSVRFTGGEPLLHPGLEKLLRLSRKLGFYTLLNTNALLFSAAKARSLAGLIDNALVSLPGVDEAGHAAGSGKTGLFGAKLAAIKRLRSAGVKVVRAGTVVSGPLVKDFGRWHKAVKSLGFDLWELYRPMMSEEALAAAPEFRVSGSDFAELAKKLFPARRSGPGGKKAGTRTVLANPVPFCALPAAARPFSLGARFDDGWTRLVLDASGVYKPSYPSKVFLGRTLAGAWKHPFLKKIRSAAWLQAECRRCAMLPVCLGGSRFQAAAAGSVFGADPWMATAPGGVRVVRGFAPRTPKRWKPLRRVPPARRGPPIRKVFAKQNPGQPSAI
ncbi:MAG: radical SAM protein [Elusimicrobia bacterium]|nr:radical SAM protein [Elusimicrobiota bacterium]